MSLKHKEDYENMLVEKLYNEHLKREYLKHLTEQYLKYPFDNTNLEKAKMQAVEFYYLEQGIEMELGRMLSIEEHNMIRAMHDNDEIGMLDMWVEKIKDAQSLLPPKDGWCKKYLEEKYLLYVRENRYMYCNDYEDPDIAREFNCISSYIHSHLGRHICPTEDIMIHALFDNGETNMLEEWYNREKEKVGDCQSPPEPESNPYVDGLVEALKREGLEGLIHDDYKFNNEGGC